MTTEYKPFRMFYRPVFVDGSDEIVTICMTDKFRRALLEASYRFLWSRNWLEDDETAVVLTDSEKSVIEAGIAALCEECLPSNGETCEVCEMTKDELIEAFLEVMDMNINVNCGCGCGCGCGKSSLPENEFLPTDPPLAGAQPPDDSGDTMPPMGNKCAKANWMFDQFRATVQFGATTESREKFIQHLVDQYGIEFSLALVTVPFAMFAVFVGHLARTTLDFVEDTLDEIHDDVVCALFNAQSVAAARSGVDSAIDGASNALARVVLRVVNQMIPYQVLFDTSIEIPSRYTGMLCCGENQIVFPALPDDVCGDYYLAAAVPVSITPQGSPPNAQLSYNSVTGQFSFTPLQLQQNNHLVTMVLDFEALPDDVYGFIVEFATVIYGDSNNGMTINSSTGGSADIKTDQVYYSAPLAMEDPCYENYTAALRDSLGATRYSGWSTSLPLTNGPKSTFVFKTAGTTTAQSFSGRILVICKRP